MTDFKIPALSFIWTRESRENSKYQLLIFWIFLLHFNSFVPYFYTYTPSSTILYTEQILLVVLFILLLRTIVWKKEHNTFYVTSRSKELTVVSQKHIKNVITGGNVTEQPRSYQMKFFNKNTNEEVTGPITSKMVEIDLTFQLHLSWLMQFKIISSWL